MVQVNTCARLLLLACAGLPVLAGRGNTSGHIFTPTVCNNAPTKVPDPGQARRSVQNLEEANFSSSAPTVVAADIPVMTASGSDRSAEAGPLEARSPSSFAIRGGRRDNLDQALDSRLAKRGGKITFADNCKAGLPSGSNNYKAQFPDKKTILMSDVAQLGYNQAVKLAAFASNVKSDNTAYKHYFGTANVDTIHKLWTKMMDLIAIPDETFTVEFTCDFTAKDCTPGGGLALAFTDATEAVPADQLKKINLCKSFFTTPSTRFILPDSQHNENSPPFRDLTSSGWCNKKSTANFFATIGHTILHELTHLDTLGKQTGLEAELDENGKVISHGTSDLAKDGDAKNAPCELAGARQYLIDYEADNTLGDPSYNAESHAAAATEAFFMDACPNNVLTDIPAQ